MNIEWISPLYDLPKEGKEVLVCIQTIGTRQIFPAKFSRAVGWTFSGGSLEFDGHCLFKGSTEFVLAWSYFEWPTNLITK
jgi:hypothetical protein